MNGTKRIQAVALLGLVAALGAACDSGLTDVNENPNQPEVVPVGSVLASGMWNLIANAAGRGVFGEMTTAFHTYLWSQHLTALAYNEKDRYTPREGVNELIWGEMYAGALLDLKRAQELAVGDGNDNLIAVTDILLVYGFLFLTDLFGDIPYEEALNLEDYRAPAFTPQSEIYPDLLRRLEVAAETIDSSSRPDWASGDLIYGGDMERWEEFAHSLRLRIAMRTQKTAYGPTAAQEFSRSWSANRFDGNGDAASLAWTGTLPSQNPMYEFVELGGRDGDFRVSQSIVDSLAARNDPRLAVFADAAASDGIMRGLRNGLLPIDENRGVADYSTIGAAFLAPDAPSVLMSYAEVLFLGAEAAARGWISGDPEALYRDAITASMEQHGIAPAAIEAYLAQPSVAYTGLDDILTQKWIALYMAGPEAFAEVRRTGIPDLTPAENGVIDEIPSRMPYPANEGLYNPNFKDYEGVDYTTPLWWM